jgi:hypothetical protein
MRRCVVLYVGNKMLYRIFRTAVCVRVLVFMALCGKQRGSATLGTIQLTAWSSDANSWSYSLEITRIFWSPKVQYRAHNSSPLAPILSQINLLYDHPYYFLKILFNIILSSTPRSSKRSVFPPRPCTNFCLPPACHTHHLSHPPTVNQHYRPFSSSSTSAAHGGTYRTRVLRCFSSV